MLDNVCVDVYCPQEKKYKSIIVENINENLISINKLEDVAILIVDKENIDAINSSIPKIPIIKERKSFEFFCYKRISTSDERERTCCCLCYMVARNDTIKPFPTSNEC